MFDILEPKRLTHTPTDLQDCLDLLSHEIHLASTGRQDLGIAARNIRQEVAGELRALSHLYWKQASETLLTDFEALERSTHLKKWAHFTHGELRSRFMAIALLLDQAHHAGTAAALKGVIEVAQELLHQPIEPQVSHQMSLREELELRVGLWDCLLPIRLTCDVQSDIPLPIVRTCGLAVEEAINNALQHGTANGVDISVQQLEDSSLEFVITNDGCHASKPIPGMGSTIYDLATGGNWSLTTPAPHRTQLRLRVQTVLQS